MKLKTTVIINEVTNLSDARYCAGMGVDFIGFRIDPGHAKYVDLENYNEITNWVAGIKFIGESATIADFNNIDHNIDQMILDDIGLLPQYNGEPALWSVSINDINEHKALIANNKAKVSGIVLTSDKNEITEEYKNQITALASDLDIFLSFGINKGNVIELINELPIKGLSLKGSDEIRPGFKDYDELADILEQLEDED